MPQENGRPDKEPDIRPDIRPTLSAVEKILEILCTALLAAGAVLLAVSYKRLPQSVPTHFNLFGEPDVYGAKGGLAMDIILMAGFYAILTVFERFPRIFRYPVEITRQNANFVYQKMREMFVFIKTEIVAAIGYVLLGSVETAMGKWHGLGGWFLIAFASALLGTLLYYIINTKKRGIPPAP